MRWLLLAAMLIIGCADRNPGGIKEGDWVRCRASGKTGVVERADLDGRLRIIDTDGNIFVRYGASMDKFTPSEKPQE